jgi:hypothetical protein
MTKQSYLTGAAINITRQAGDTGSIVFEVPAFFSMTGRAAQFQIRDDDFSLLKISPTHIDLSGQTITVNLLEADFKGIYGVFRWELQATITGEVTTIGRGNITILEEIIS